MSRKDDLLNKLSKKEAYKPPVDGAYDQKSEIIKHFTGWEDGNSEETNLSTKITSKELNNEKIIEEANDSTIDEINKTLKEEKNIVRKRVSFDIRVDLHKQLKMQALLQDKNIYMLIEEAIEKYLNKE